MNRPETVSLRYLARGSWMAKADMPSGKRLIGTDAIPVLRIYASARFDANLTAYTAPARSLRLGKRPDWWNETSQKEWRNALAPGGIAAMRDGRDDGSENGTVGKWRGIWQIGSVRFDDAEMTVFFSGPRLAEVAP